jgi:hypothetical protein
MRPGTLAKVAPLTAGGASFNLALANFLDEFYAAPNASRLSTEPDFLVAHARRTRARARRLPCRRC